MAETRRNPLPAVIQEAREREEKWCRACDDFHPFSDFGADASRKDGLRDHCREADRKKSRLRYAENAGEGYRSWFANAPEGFITRRDAVAQGLKEFFDGRPCPKGHIAPKRVDSYGCTECHKAIAKRWEAKGPPHPERLDAIANKAVTFIGKQCQNGHDGLRLTKNGRCAHCTRLRVSNWLARNPDYDATGKTRERRRKDPTKHRASSRKWAAANKEIVKAALLRWQQDNPERLAALRRAGSTRRRTRKMENGGTFSADDIMRLFEEQDGHCACCGDVSDRMEIDHIMPVFLGGNSDPENLQLLCFWCNRTKGALHPDEWRRRLRMGTIVLRSRALL